MPQSGLTDRRAPTRSRSLHAHIDYNRGMDPWLNDCLSCTAHTYAVTARESSKRFASVVDRSVPLLSIRGDFSQGGLSIDYQSVVLG